MKLAKKRIAITGIGIVSPLANTAEATWKALIDKKSGLTEITSFDASNFPSRVAAEVKGFELDTNIPSKLKKYASKFVQFALNAAEEALTDANIRPTITSAERWGLVTGAGMMTAEFSTLQSFQQSFAVDGQIDWKQVKQGFARHYSTAEFGRTIANSGLALLLNHYQIKGYANSVHTACASGGQALGLAMQAIRRGDADYMLAGGFDSMINPVGVSSFCLLGALSPYNDTPASASRPFDYTRKGFVLGEGAAFLVLESFESAHKRGAPIYAELAGEGNTLSSYRITDSHPSGDGAIQAIKQALKDANLKEEWVDYINAHGTSTKMNDLSETNAIQAVFKQRALEIPVSSTKSQTGHLIAAAGALEGALTALSIKHGVAPMTANLNERDPECPLDYVTDGPRPMTIGVAMTNSFGFGGSNSCLALTHPDYEEHLK